METGNPKKLETRYKILRIKKKRKNINKNKQQALIEIFCSRQLNSDNRNITLYRQKPIFESQTLHLFT
jgi:hypothetical protein